MKKKVKSPIIVGQPVEPELLPPMTVDESMSLYVALYTDWRDADIVLENMGYALEQDGILVPLSDRIQQAIKDAKER